MKQTKKEVTDFLAGVIRGTELGHVKWERTADEDVLVAPIEGGFTLRLSRVPDFDFQGDPDHILSLMTGGNDVFAVNRLDIGHEALGKRLGVLRSSTYEFFSRLWDLAEAEAERIPDEVDQVAKLLWNKISKDDIPF